MYKKKNIHTYMHTYIYTTTNTYIYTFIYTTVIYVCGYMYGIVKFFSSSSDLLFSCKNFEKKERH